MTFKKRFLLNSVFITLAFLASSGMFLLKQQVLEKEHNLRSLKRKTIKIQRDVHILKAELSNLLDNKRLNILNDAYLGLQQTQPNQIIDFEDIPLINPEEE